MSVETRIRNLFAKADIRINGDRPWDMQVHNRRLYYRILGQISLGLGESYVDGWWDCERPDEFTSKLLAARLEQCFGPLLMVDLVKSWCMNRQTVARSKRVAKQHYDLGNHLYTCMLDKNMQYTCGYWRDADNLDDAQLAKLDLICRKLYLEPGMNVLELGGGFGGLARYMAAEHGCRVVSYNISEEQVKYARGICEGLPVEIVLADYREATGIFDRVVSVGLTEHIGPKNYRGFMELAHRNLKDDGLFLLHTIGNRRTVPVSNPWIRKYIFPEGYIPSARQLSAALDELFVMEDWHNFGPHYDRTLLAWHANFLAHWEELKSQFDERFYRMWRMYLLASAGGFRSRNLQLWQIVMSKKLSGGYASVR